VRQLGYKHIINLSLLFLLTALTIVGCGLARPLPKPEIPETTVILDSAGNVIDTLFEENRIVISDDKIPALMRQALVAVEDERFYQHHGFDLNGIARAIYRNVRAWDVVEGGSTLTQQLAKNLYLTHERTFTRKVKEALLTVELERTYTKTEILNMYLNLVYFGRGAYGIEVASRRYFGKNAEDLTLEEAATLAALPRAPSYYDPFKRPEKVKTRRNFVLNKMVELNFISAEQADATKEKPLKLASLEVEDKAPYFVQEVIGQLSQKLPEESIYRGGLKVYTTLDLRMQESAQQAVKEVLAEQDPQLQAALAAIDPATGYVKALVGGRNFEESQFNRATQARRQPGSSMKPFLYAAAIDRGYTQATTIRCEPVEYPLPSGEVYKPEDYGDEPYHYREFTLLEALQHSDNVVAVRLNYLMGPEALVQEAKNMGITTPLQPYLSLALGSIGLTPLELARGYATLAAGGIKTDPIFIKKVVGEEDDVILEHKPKRAVALSKSTAYLVTNMMESVLEPGGTASNLRQYLTRPAAGKTGTTDKYRDAWFAGFTPQLSTAVYVGFDDQSRSIWLPGGRVAGPIWAKFMAKAMENQPVKAFSVPNNIVKIDICLDSGLRATQYCPRVKTMSFIKGTEPKQFDNTHDPSRNWNNSSSDKEQKRNPGQGKKQNGLLDWLQRLRNMY